MDTIIITMITFIIYNLLTLDIFWIKYTKTQILNLTNLNDNRFKSAFKHSLKQTPFFCINIKNMTRIKKWKKIKLIIIIMFMGGCIIYFNTKLKVKRYRKIDEF